MKKKELKQQIERLQIQIKSNLDTVMNWIIDETKSRHQLRDEILSELNKLQDKKIEVGNDINVVSKADYAVELLKQYAMENQTLIRSTSDLSPLEQWLLLKLSKRINKEQLLELFVEYAHTLTDQAGVYLFVIDSDDFDEIAEKILELQGEK